MLKQIKDREISPIKINIISAFLIIVIFIIDLQIPLGVAGGIPYIAVILISLWSPRPNCVIYLAIVCSVMTLLGFYFSPNGGELWKVIFNRALALFAIWITAILALKWKVHEEEIFSLNHKIENEKEKIYLATIKSAQHITNNLLNQLKVVELEIENNPAFDKEVLSMFHEMQSEADTLMQDLSSVDKINDQIILDSVYPK